MRRRHGVASTALKEEAMKAAVYYETGPPDVFRYEEIEDPPLHSDGVLIDVQAVSIEGGDVLNRWHGQMPSRPWVVGYQCAGIIREVGANVTAFSNGQRVVAFVAHGSHASVVAAPIATTWHVPDGLDIQRAACVPIAFATADDCLFEFGHLKASETVLIQGGAGGVGLAAVQLAKRAGARVLATASSDEKLQRLKEYGLDEGINYAAGDFVSTVRELTGGRGVDLVVDPIGGKTLQGSIECLAYRGRAVCLGSAGRSSERPDVTLLIPGNRSLTGYFMGGEMAMQHERLYRIVERHLGDVAAGSLQVVIDRTYPLVEAAAAHAYIESRQAFGRVLLIP
jgi:NADPH2:quinone reductase